MKWANSSLHERRHQASQSSNLSQSSICPAVTPILTLPFFFSRPRVVRQLYCITSPNLPQQYLVRVALLAEPFLETESEVVTLAYIRQYTTTPVSKVLAYCLSAENILIEKIDGVPLADVRDGMSFDSKASLTVEICEHLDVLQDLQFTKIGSLHFSSI